MKSLSLTAATFLLLVFTGLTLQHASAQGPKVIRLHGPRTYGHPIYVPQFVVSPPQTGFYGSRMYGSGMIGNNYGLFNSPNYGLFSHGTPGYGAEQANFMYERWLYMQGD